MSINLTSTNHLLELVTTGAGAVHVTASFIDDNAGTKTGGSQTTIISSATTTTIVSAPGASIVRSVHHINVQAVVGNTVTVQKDVAATDHILIGPIALTDGQRLEFTASVGWKKTDSTGSGSIALPAIADDTFLANISGGSAAPSAIALTTLAGAGLTGGANAVLDVGSSTSIAVNANDIQRAALTGDVTAPQNSNATTIANGVVTLAKQADLAQATIVGRALAAGTGVPTALTGAQTGEIIRFAGFVGSSLAAATYNDHALADGTKLFDVDPTGDVIFTGFALGSSNAGGFFTLGKFNADGRIIIKHNNAGSVAANRIFTPGGVDYILSATLDTVFIVYLNSRWQVVERANDGFNEVELTGAGPHNDYDPAGAAHIMASNAAGVMTGVVNGGVVGALLVISHQGSGYTELQHNSASSGVSNRFFNGRLGKNLRVYDNEIAIYRNINTAAGGTTLRWELISPNFPFAHASDSAAGDVIAHNGTNYAVVVGGNSADVVLRGNSTFGTVSNAAIRDSAGLSVIGRSANSTGDVADIVAANDGEVLRRSGTALGFGLVSLPGIATQAANTVVANVTGSTASPTAHPLSTLAGEHLDYSAGVISWKKSRTVCVWWEDFECVNSSSSTGPHHFGQTVWITTALSTSGLVSFQTGEQNHPGICRVQTDAVDNSVYSIHRGGPDADDLWVSGDSIREFEAIVRSSLTETKAFMIGFNDNTPDVTTSGPGDIIAFMFDSDNAALDVNIHCVVKETSAGGTPTITDSGISLASVQGTWISLRIRQTTLGTVEFLINDSVVATNATRIADDEMLNCGITVITRDASATAIDVDYVYFESQPLTRF